jgi:hypothetical protein
MSWEIAGILAGGLCVLGIFSFLWRENPVYRFFEHLYIGVATGYGVVMVVTRFLWPKWLQPHALDLERAAWESYHWINVLWFLPAIFGLLMYFILSRKRAWLAQIVIGVGLGWSGGLAFRGFFNEFLPQLIDSFRPLLALQPGPGGGLDLKTTLENILFAATLLCVMTYFFFSFEHDKPGIKQASALGRWLMMVTFGAFFGSTVMARMALLIDRLQFMTHDWVRAIENLFRGG